MPLHWELWRAVIATFLLYELTPIQKWMGLVSSLEKSYIYIHPLELAALTYLESLALDNLFDSKGNIVLLCQSSLCWRDKNHTGPIVAKNLRQVDIQKMIRQHRVGSIPEISFYKDWDEERARLGLPQDFDKLLPRTQVSTFAGTGADTAVIGNFIRLGKRVNCVRSVEGSLRCVASGVNSYASFFSLVWKPFLPPTEENVLLWGSTSKPGATYRGYLWQLKKACFLTGPPVDCYAATVRDVPNCLRHAKKSSFKFPNFIYTQDLFMIINGLGWEDSFSLLASVSFF